LRGEREIFPPSGLWWVPWLRETGKMPDVKKVKKRIFIRKGRGTPVFNQAEEMRGPWVFESRRGVPSWRGLWTVHQKKETPEKGVLPCFIEGGNG